MRKATTYKKLASLKPAIERCPAEKIVNVSSDKYYVLTPSDYKVLQFLGIKPQSIHPHFAGCYGGHKHHKIVGYRVTLQVGAIVVANLKMFTDIGRYL